MAAKKKKRKKKRGKGDKPKPRGFACISPEKRAEYGRRGARAAHAAGTAHQFTSREAAQAAKRGWESTPKSQRKRRRKTSGERVQ